MLQLPSKDSGSRGGKPRTAGELRICTGSRAQKGKRKESGFGVGLGFCSATPGISGKLLSSWVGSGCLVEMLGTRAQSRGLLTARAADPGMVRWQQGREVRALQRGLGCWCVPSPPTPPPAALHWAPACPGTLHGFLERARIPTRPHQLRGVTGKGNHPSGTAPLKCGQGLTHGGQARPQGDREGGARCLSAHTFHGTASGTLHRRGNWGRPPPHFCSSSGDPSQAQPCQEGGHEEGRGSKTGQAPAPGDTVELPELPCACLGHSCLPTLSSSQTPKPSHPLLIPLPVPEAATSAGCPHPGMGGMSWRTLPASFPPSLQCFQPQPAAELGARVCSLVPLHASGAPGRCSSASHAVPAWSRGVAWLNPPTRLCKVLLPHRVLTVLLFPLCFSPSSVFYRMGQWRGKQGNSTSLKLGMGNAAQAGPASMP